MAQAINWRTEASSWYDMIMYFVNVVKKRSPDLVQAVNLCCCYSHTHKTVGGILRLDIHLQEERNKIFCLPVAPPSPPQLGNPPAQTMRLVTGKKRRTCGGWSLGMKGEERREFVREGNQKASRKEGFLLRRPGGRIIKTVLGLWGSGGGGEALQFEMTTRLPSHVPTFHLGSVSKWDSRRRSRGSELKADLWSLLAASPTIPLAEMWRPSLPSPPLLSSPFHPPGLLAAETESGVWDQAAVLGGAAGPPPAAARQLERGAVGQAQHGQPGGACCCWWRRWR